MNVLIFGATGGTGRELVKQAERLGHEVTAFVRDPTKLENTSENCRVYKGNVADRASVERATASQDAAISALGSGTLRRRSEELALGKHNILVALEYSCVKRFIYLSADTVPEARRDLNPLRRLIISTLLRNTAADHELDEAVVRQSRLEWIIVRPPLLTNSPHTGRYRFGEGVEPKSLFPKISRADLADFMLKQLADDTFVRRAPTVMY
ncbi:MAG TPA: NAD(P)H-binding protein [Candidatus Acidoferrales bacterium]|nr:NAD(P)H-binding protein [Candidatus Acidoferrales bacterium]